MFRPDPAVTQLSLPREEVVAVVESINQPQISIPGKQPQGAQAHLCGVRNADGSFSVYVCLFLLESGETVTYVHEPSRFPVARYREVESEGLHFLESMGFMLDNLRFRNLSPEQQGLAMERVPLFSPRKVEAAPARAGEGPRQGSAVRLLACF
jgi:hypothetical protein